MSSEIDTFVPDYLMQALELDAEVGSLDLFSDSANSMPKLRRVEIPQRISAKHAGNIGKIYISGMSADEEGEYVDKLDFLLVSSLVWNMSANNPLPEELRNIPELKKQMAGGVGGRTMWEFKDDGSRNTDAKAPVCSSPNGIEVWRNSVGKEVFDYRTGKTEKIGFKLNDDGTYSRREHSCVGCPFAEWISVPTGEVDAAGEPVMKSHAAMCRQTFSWLIWSVDHQELMTIKAVNLGMQFALNGSYSKAGRRYDDAQFKNIERFFSASGQHKLENGTVVAAFANRPQGRPSVDNPNAPVYAVRMTVTTNNFSPASLVPQLTILDGKAAPIVMVNPKAKGGAWMNGSLMLDAEQRALTPEQYVAYLNDMQKAISDNYKSKFMATNIINRHGDNNGVAGELPASAAASAPSLPTGAAPTDPTAAQKLDDPFAFAN